MSVQTTIHEPNSPLISIITPAYHSEEFIADTIESVLAQTYPNWELIIVDDCSQDQTVDIVKSYAKKDARIKLYTLNENRGPAITRNTAIQHANGRYLAFLDSDDQWLPEKLEKQLRFMQDHQIAFSFTAYHVIEQDGTATGTISEVPDRAVYTDLLKNNVVGCLTVMLDRAIIGDVEMVNIRSRQDYALWLDITRRGFPAYGMSEPLAKYRTVANSLSSNKVKMAKQNWRVYREIEKLNLVKSMWYFMHFVYFKVKKYSK